MAYKVISITDRNGNKLPIEKMEFLHIGKDYAISNYQGFGFMKNYAGFDGYTVVTEKVEA